LGMAGSSISPASSNVSFSPPCSSAFILRQAFPVWWEEWSLQPQALFYQPSKSNRKLFPYSSSESLRVSFHWPTSGHVPIPEPITTGQGM
jgi:hypothetical protein